MSKQFFWVSVLVIVLVTLLVRGIGLGNTSFVADEFLDINSAMGYAETGTWQSWDFNYEQPATQNLNEARDERAVIYKWQVAQALRFLPAVESNARLISVLWGAISVLVIIWATWFLTGCRKASLIAGALFALAVSAIVFDRRLRMYAMFYPLYLLASVFFFATLERTYQGKLRFVDWVQKITGYHLGYGILAILFLGLSFLTHQLAGTLIFIVVAYCAWRIAEERSIQNVYGQTLGLLGVFFVGTFVLAPNFVQSFTRGLIWFDNHYSYWAHFWSDFEHPLLALIAMLGGAWYFASVRNRRAESIFLLLSFFVPMLLAIWFWRRNVGPQYIFMAQSFGLILAAMGVRGLGFVFERLFTSSWRKRSMLVAGVLGLLLLPRYSYFFQDENAYRQPASGETTNYRKLFTTFNESRQNADVLVTRNFRNFYFAGAHIPVYDFGGELSEQKLQKEELEKLQKQYKTGFIVLAKNDFDYVSKSAEDFLESPAFTKVSHPTVRGGNAVYRW